MKYTSLPIVATLPEIGTHRTMVVRSGPFAARGTPEFICTSLTVPGYVDGGGASCRPLDDRIGPKTLHLNLTQIRDPGTRAIVVIHGGPVGADIHSLELLFQDGTHANIPLHHGYVLYQVNPANDANGHQPTTVVGRNVSGKTVIRTPFSQA
jgi:hypothetical protein